MSRNIIVTGGLGYIGSHIALSFAELGHNVDIIDNLSNSTEEVIDSLTKLSDGKIQIFKQDLNDHKSLNINLSKADYHLVVHCAGYKSVPESFKHPEKYIKGNINLLKSTMNLIKERNIKNLIFSSTASLYDSSQSANAKETCKLSPLSPYAQSKKICEEAIQKFSETYHINYVIFRYFNPIGAHDSAKIGDNPITPQDGIISALRNATDGKILNIYGGNYPTKDGTAIRDFIHISDLTKAHVLVAKKLFQKDSLIKEIFNIGTGKGSTVLELKDAYSKASGKYINYNLADIRDGDIPISVSNIDKFQEFFNWKPRKTLLEMSKSDWKFYNSNII